MVSPVAINISLSGLSVHFLTWPNLCQFTDKHISSCISIISHMGLQYSCYRTSFPSRGTWATQIFILGHTLELVNNLQSCFNILLQSEDIPQTKANIMEDVAGSTSLTLPLESKFEPSFGLTSSFTSKPLRASFNSFVSFHCFQSA